MCKDLGRHHERARQLDDVVLAEMLWAAFRRLFTVTAILGVMLALGISHSPSCWLAWPVLLGVGIMFRQHRAHLQRAGAGLRLFTYYFTLVLTPMMFCRACSSRASSCPPLVRAPSPTGCR